MHPSSSSGSYHTPDTVPPPVGPGMSAFSVGDSFDAQLLDRMRQGDERALGALYDRWFPVVHAVVARVVGSGDDVEDVVEETFWQAWRQADRYVGERGTVRTWLLTIARSRALDRARALRRRRETSLDEPAPSGGPTAVAEGDIAAAAAEWAVSSGSDPAAAAESAERRRLVRAALGELPTEQREALELAYFGGLSQSEIAERIGQPLGTIKTRMRLAMQKLRGRLLLLREDGP